MRSLLYIILFLCFSIITPGVYPQAGSINDGETHLTPLPIDFKNKKIEITPILTYSQNKPGELTIKLKAEFLDKNKEAVEDNTNWVFLISDYDKFKEYYSSPPNNLRVGVLNPSYLDDYQECVPVELVQDSKYADVVDFNSGFNGFRDMSASIKVVLDPAIKSDIVLKIRLIHGIRSPKKLDLKYKPFELSWKFRLPQPGGAVAVAEPVAQVNCQDFEKNYNKLIDDIIQDRSIGYFNRQLKNESTDLDRLSAELKDFKGDMVKAEGLRKVMKGYQDLNECPELKVRLISRLDKFIVQKDAIGAVERDISSKKENVCVNYENKYALRVNKVKLNKNQKYFSDKINKPDADLWDIEDELKTYEKEINNAKKLKKEIIRDTRSSKCANIKNRLLGKIGNLENLDKLVVITQGLINDEREKYEEDTELSFEKLTQRYNTYFSERQDDFSLFTSEFFVTETEILERYQNNIDLIAYLKGVKASETDNIDSLQKAKEALVLCVQENGLNLETIDNSLADLSKLSTEIEILIEGCNKDFTKIDKSNGPKKAKAIINNFNGLLSEISRTTKDIESIRKTLSDNNKEIYKLGNVFNPGMLIKKEKVISKYDSLFKINVEIIEELEEDYLSLGSDFNERRKSKSYYSWVKNNMHKQSTGYEEELNELRNNTDTLIISKEIAFDKHSITVYLEEIRKFNQLETDLRPRLEHLSSEIDNSIVRKFPWIYLILGVIMLVILGFGAKIYIGVYRKKKKEEAIKNNKVDSPVTKISITGTKENVLLKGKGLKEVRAKAGLEFLEIEMAEEWDDSAVKKVYFKKDCIIKIYQFFEDSLQSTETDDTAFETGGYILGRWDMNLEDPKKFDVSLEDFIEPGDDAKFSHYQLNFGAKIGIKLQKALSNIKEKTAHDFIMTAWFHSHPGLKIFLSDFDISVQEGFSSNRETLKMLALVLDPYTSKWDTGIFSYKSDGSVMNNAIDSKRFYSLDEMYTWALGKEKKPEITITETVKTPENRYTIDLTDTGQNLVCGKVYVENPMIIELKRHIDMLGSDSLNKISSHILGQKIVHTSDFSDLILDSIVEAGSGEDTMDEKAVGFIICTEGEDVDLSALFVDLKGNNDQFIIALIYNITDQSIALISKNKQLIFEGFSGLDKHQFSEMIEWTRKRK